jgi:hypothetical protein
MNQLYPHRRVGLITFSNDIEIIGDGSNPSMKIQRKYLLNEKKIMNTALQASDSLFVNPIKDTFANLIERVKNLGYKTCTAMGPALLAAVAIASKGKQGSLVIVCTDGLANEGLGDFDTKDAKKLKDSLEFYERCGMMAKERGVKVNLITLIGSECYIQGLSPVADMTNGEIERVDPSKLDSNFSRFVL